MENAKSKRILVIDDSEPLLEYMKYILSKWGHTVVTAVDGEEGLARFGEQSFDIVITDIVMPRKDGIELIIDMKKLKPGTKVIAISGAERSESLLKIADIYKAEAQLLKPFTEDQLLAAINAVA